jgi:hypothetical protein
VPHSVFTGRIVGPGEPQFLAEDTDGAIALAEEEADTCGQCGMLRVWCRDPDHQFSFEAHEEVCWPTYRLAQERNKDTFKGYDDATRTAVQLSARFRDGHEPDLTAGLELGDQETVTASAE